MSQTANPEITGDDSSTPYDPEAIICATEILSAPPSSLSPSRTSSTSNSSPLCDPAAMVYTSEPSSPSSSPASSTSEPSSPPPPPSPRRWKWHCHRCGRSLPMAARRDLRGCGHTRCTARSPRAERLGFEEHKKRIQRLHRESILSGRGRPGEQRYSVHDKLGRTRLLELLDTDTEFGSKGKAIGTDVDTESVAAATALPSQRAASGVILDSQTRTASVAASTSQERADSITTTSVNSGQADGNVSTASPTASAQDSTSRAPAGSSSPAQSTQQGNSSTTTTASTSTTTAPGTTTSKRKRPAGLDKCTTSFDYAGWADWGEWRRAEKRRRVIREMDRERAEQESWARSNALAVAMFAASREEEGRTAAEEEEEEDDSVKETGSVDWEIIAEALDGALKDARGQRGEGGGGRGPQDHTEEHKEFQMTNSRVDTLFLRETSPDGEFDEIFPVLAREREMLKKGTTHAKRSPVGTLFPRPGGVVGGEPDVFAMPPHLQSLADTAPAEQKGQEAQDQDEKRKEYEPTPPALTIAPGPPPTPRPEQAAALPKLPPRPTLKDWRKEFAHDCLMDCDYVRQCRKKRRSEAAEKVWHEDKVAKGRRAMTQ
ncbi:hypothetical protein Micbo1qcDRAFT_199161 [Microdochium bolleyi]|uniref:Uncharacterized protein n=1 Tax=Microdochium bolleyi TaxID=196109 RepID=A0A136JGW7_9PEZI|nr:hypothetical protein Micbo1qcDRAFT_199161 [Microdochium bolleyi]